MLLYYQLPHRHRWFLLFVASCYFYMVFIPKYILVLFALILIDYTAGLFIAGAETRRKKKFYLGISIVANCLLLCVFKYFNFFAENIAWLAQATGIPFDPFKLDLILPIGLSFHTFQSIAYTFEVYYGRVPAEKHLGIYAVYVLFFPQMVAGPIERPQHVLPQLHNPVTFDAEKAVEGLRLILWGFLKKLMIADNLAVVVDRVYKAPQDFSGPNLTLATICFAFQIYCDFSGYSDIARGSAKLMGIELMQNFDSPYFARSVADFWRRWHISLSTWFRDYLYIPLGGNRAGPWRRRLNVMVVFAVSGLWHGANWTYIIWGMLHGFFLLAFMPRTNGGTAVSGVRLLPRIVLTFLLVDFAWIFFRAATVADAWTVISGLPFGWSTAALAEMFAGTVTGEHPLMLLTYIFGLLLFEFLQTKRFVLSGFFKAPPPLRWGVYYAALFLIVFFGKFDAKVFIYFQY